jgi:peptidylprolyl isomerase
LSRPVLEEVFETMRFTLSLMLLATLATPALADPKPPVQPAAPAQSAAIPPPLTAENTWNLDLSTGGRVVIQLRPDKAPQAAERIRVLTRRGFYDGLTFHRVIEGFMAQGGDPKGTGEGGSNLPDLKAEFNELPHVRGAVALARASDENSANSQFYIMLSPNLRLDNRYTVFGRVVSGMNFVDTLERGEPPATPSRIVHATIGAEPVLAVRPVQPEPVATPEETAPPPTAPAVPPATTAPETAPRR